MVRTAGAIALVAILTGTLLASAESSDPDTQRRRQSRSQALKVGDKAPAVMLEYLRDGKIYDLKESFGKRPTVLIFGSYT
ncbi:MAG: hypothetical protein IH945_12120 [Armatimonadetes bacterium]|nr:hypothetical protein [Armatimonadota bacterium]